MRDVIVVAIIAVFFALCVAYVRWCDRIIGPDPDDLRDDDIDHAPTFADDVVDVAATAGATPIEPTGVHATTMRS
jgi:hypothetical protein